MKPVRLLTAALLIGIAFLGGCGKKAAPRTAEEKPRNAAPLGQPMRGYTQFGGGPTYGPGQAPPAGAQPGAAGEPAPVGE